MIATPTKPTTNSSKMKAAAPPAAAAPSSSSPRKAAKPLPFHTLPLARAIVDEAVRTAKRHPTATTTEPYDLNGIVQNRWASWPKRCAIDRSGAAAAAHDGFASVWDAEEKGLTTALMADACGLVNDFVIPASQSVPADHAAATASANTPNGGANGGVVNVPAVTKSFFKTEKIPRPSSVSDGIDDGLESFAAFEEAPMTARSVCSSTSSHIDPSANYRVRDNGRTLVLYDKAVLLHVWAFPTDACVFHESTRRLMQALTRHIVGAPFAAPLVSLVAHGAQLVTVAWLPPLVSSTAASVVQNSSLSATLDIITSELPSTAQAHETSSKVQVPVTSPSAPPPVFVGRDSRLYIFGLHIVSKPTSTQQKRSSSSFSQVVAPLDLLLDDTGNVVRTPPPPLPTTNASPSTNAVAATAVIVTSSEPIGTEAVIAKCLNGSVRSRLRATAAASSPPAVAAGVPASSNAGPGGLTRSSSPPLPSTSAPAANGGLDVAATLRSVVAMVQNPSMTDAAVAQQFTATANSLCFQRRCWDYTALALLANVAPLALAQHFGKFMLDLLPAPPKDEQVAPDEARLLSAAADPHRLSASFDPGVPFLEVESIGESTSAEGEPSPFQISRAGGSFRRAPDLSLDVASSLCAAHRWANVASLLCSGLHPEEIAPAGTMPRISAALQRSIASLASPQREWTLGNAAKGANRTPTHASLSPGEQSLKTQKGVGDASIKFSTDEALQWRRWMTRVAASVDPLSLNRRCGEALSLAGIVTSTLLHRDHDPRWATDGVPIYTEAFTTLVLSQDHFFLPQLRTDPRLTHSDFRAFTLEAVDLVESGGAFDLNLTDAVLVACGLLVTEVTRWEEHSFWDEDGRHAALEELRRVAFGQHTITTPYMVVPFTELLRESMGIGGLGVAREALRLLREFFAEKFPDTEGREIAETLLPVVGGVVLVRKCALKWRRGTRRAIEQRQRLKAEAEEARRKLQEPKTVEIKEEAKTHHASASWKEQVLPGPEEGQSDKQPSEKSPPEVSEAQKELDAEAEKAAMKKRASEALAEQQKRNSKRKANQRNARRRASAVGLKDAFRGLPDQAPEGEEERRVSTIGDDVREKLEALKKAEEERAAVEAARAAAEQTARDHRVQLWLDAESAMEEVVASELSFRRILSESKITEEGTIVIRHVTNDDEPVAREELLQEAFNAWSELLMSNFLDHEAIVRSQGLKDEETERSEIAGLAAREKDAIRSAEYARDAAKGRAAFESDESTARAILLQDETTSWGDNVMIPMVEDSESITRNESLRPAEAQLWDAMVELHRTTIDEDAACKAITADESTMVKPIVSMMMEEQEAITRNALVSSESHAWNSALFEFNQKTLHTSEVEARAVITDAEVTTVNSLVLPMMEDREAISRTALLKCEVDEWDRMMNEHMLTVASVLGKEAADAVSQFELNESEARALVLRDEGTAIDNVLFTMLDEHEAILRQEIGNENDRAFVEWQESKDHGFILRDAIGAWHGLQRAEMNDRESVARQAIIHDINVTTLEIEEDRAFQEMCIDRRRSQTEVIAAMIEDHERITRDQITATESLMWSSRLVEEEEQRTRLDLDQGEASAWGTLLSEHAATVNAILSGETAVAAKALELDEDNSRQKIIDSETGAWALLDRSIIEEREAVMRAALDAALDGDWEALLRSHMEGVAKIIARRNGKSLAALELEETVARETMVTAFLEVRQFDFNSAEQTALFIEESDARKSIEKSEATFVRGTISPFADQVSCLIDESHSRRIVAINEERQRSTNAVVFTEELETASRPTAIGEEDRGLRTLIFQLMIEEHELIIRKEALLSAERKEWDVIAGTYAQSSNRAGKTFDEEKARRRILQSESDEWYSMMLPLLEEREAIERRALHASEFQQAAVVIGQQAKSAQRADHIIDEQEARLKIIRFEAELCQAVVLPMIEERESIARTETFLQSEAEEMKALMEDHIMKSTVILDSEFASAAVSLDADEEKHRADIDQLMNVATLEIEAMMTVEREAVARADLMAEYDDLLVTLEEESAQGQRNIIRNARLREEFGHRLAALEARELSERSKTVQAEETADWITIMLQRLVYDESAPRLVIEAEEQSVWWDYILASHMFEKDVIEEREAAEHIDVRGEDFDLDDVDVDLPNGPRCVSVQTDDGNDEDFSWEWDRDKNKPRAADKSHARGAVNNADNSYFSDQNENNAEMDEFDFMAEEARLDAERIEFQKESERAEERLLQEVDEDQHRQFVLDAEHDELRRILDDASFQRRMMEMQQLAVRIVCLVDVDEVDARDRVAASFTDHLSEIALVRDAEHRVVLGIERKRTDAFARHEFECEEIEIRREFETQLLAEVQQFLESLQRQAEDDKVLQNERISVREAHEAQERDLKRIVDEESSFRRALTSQYRQRMLDTNKLFEVEYRRALESAEDRADIQRLVCEVDEREARRMIEDTLLRDCKRWLFEQSFSSYRGISELDETAARRMMEGLRSRQLAVLGFEEERHALEATERQARSVLFDTATLGARELHLQQATGACEMDQAERRRSNVEVEQHARSDLTTRFSAEESAMTLKRRSIQCEDAERDARRMIGEVYASDVDAFECQHAVASTRNIITTFSESSHESDDHDGAADDMQAVREQSQIESPVELQGDTSCRGDDAHRGPEPAGELQQIADEFDRELDNISAIDVAVDAPPADAPCSPEPGSAAEEEGTATALSLDDDDVVSLFRDEETNRQQLDQSAFDEADIIVCAHHAAAASLVTVQDDTDAQCLFEEHLARKAEEERYDRDLRDLERTFESEREVLHETEREREGREDEQDYVQEQQQLRQALEQEELTQRRNIDTGHIQTWAHLKQQFESEREVLCEIEQEELSQRRNRDNLSLLQRHEGTQRSDIEEDNDRLRVGVRLELEAEREVLRVFEEEERLHRERQTQQRQEVEKERARLVAQQQKQEEEQQRERQNGQHEQQIAVLCEEELGQRHVVEDQAACRSSYLRREFDTERCILQEIEDEEKAKYAERCGRARLTQVVDDEVAHRLMAVDAHSQSLIALRRDFDMQRPVENRDRVSRRASERKSSRDKEKEEITVAAASSLPSSPPALPAVGDPLRSPSAKVRSARTVSFSPESGAVMDETPITVSAVTRRLPQLSSTSLEEARSDVKEHTQEVTPVESAVVTSSASLAKSDTPLDLAFGAKKPTEEDDLAAEKRRLDKLMGRLDAKSLAFFERERGQREKERTEESIRRERSHNASHPRRQRALNQCRSPMREDEGLYFGSALIANCSELHDDEFGMENSDDGEGDDGVNAPSTARGRTIIGSEEAPSRAPVTPRYTAAPLDELSAEEERLAALLGRLGVSDDTGGLSESPPRHESAVLGETRPGEQSSKHEDAHVASLKEEEVKRKVEEPEIASGIHSTHQALAQKEKVKPKRSADEDEEARLEALFAKLSGGGPQRRQPTATDRSAVGTSTRSAVTAIPASTETPHAIPTDRARMSNPNAGANEERSEWWGVVDFLSGRDKPQEADPTTPTKTTSVVPTQIITPAHQVVTPTAATPTEAEAVTPSATPSRFADRLRRVTKDATPAKHDRAVVDAAPSSGEDPSKNLNPKNNEALAPTHISTKDAPSSALSQQSRSPEVQRSTSSTSAARAMSKYDLMDQELDIAEDSDDDAIDPSKFAPMTKTTKSARPLKSTTATAGDGKELATSSVERVTPQQRKSEQQNQNRPLSSSKRPMSGGKVLPRPTSARKTATAAASGAVSSGHHAQTSSVSAVPSQETSTSSPVLPALDEAPTPNTRATFDSSAKVGVDSWASPQRRPHHQLPAAALRPFGAAAPTATDHVGTSSLSAASKAHGARPTGGSGSHGLSSLAASRRPMSAAVRSEFTLRGPLRPASAQLSASASASGVGVGGTGAGAGAAAARSRLQQQQQRGLERAGSPPRRGPSAAEIGPYCARPFAAVRGGELKESLAAARVDLMRRTDA